jgi:hypothetical protein
LLAHARVLLWAAAWLGGATAALPVRAQNPDDKGIVCWQDEHGQRACGDHVPPQYAKKQRDIYNQRGVVIKTLKAEETPEQRAAEQHAADEAQRQLEEQQKQQANDKFVLQTYRTVDELKAERDNRLASFDTRQDLAEKAVQRGDAALKDLQSRADAERSAGRDPSFELEAQIKSFAAAQAENIDALERIKQEREATAAQFEHYIDLYQQVHGVAPLPLPTPLAPEGPQPPLAPKP